MIYQTLFIWVIHRPHPSIHNTLRYKRQLQFHQPAAMHVASANIYQE